MDSNATNVYSITHVSLHVTISGFLTDEHTNAISCRDQCRLACHRDTNDTVKLSLHPVCMYHRSRRLLMKMIRLHCCVIPSTIDVRKSCFHNYYHSALSKTPSQCYYPNSDISPSALHRLPANSLTRRWRRHSPSSKISVIALRLRVIARRVQTRLILR